MNNRQLRIVSDDIFNRHFVGFERVFDHFANLQANGYPPHNILDVGADGQQIELAVAGFSPDDMTITVEKGILSIEGELPDDDIRVFLHHGISSRKFVKQFSLAEYFEVTSAEFNNGILSITIKEEIPEAHKPKVIEIKDNS